MLRSLLLGASVAALTLAPSAAAAGGSLVYTKDGNVHIAAPDGSGATQITSDGGYQWPSQDDAGIIVAARQTAENGRNPRRLHRMNRSGTALHAPIVTVPVDNSFYIGPLAPKVSPDGQMVAYHYFYTGPITSSTLPRIGLSHSDRDTVNGEITSTLGGYFTPSWTQDNRLLAFYAAERVYNVDLWSRDDTVQNWFGDAGAGALLTDGEVTADGRRLAATGETDDLRIYSLSGIGGDVVLQCTITGLGEITDPTWSPDGTQLAWEQADGIHVAMIPASGPCQDVARPLVIAGGKTPDWGPAAAPSAGGGPNGGGGNGGGNGGGGQNGGAGNGSTPNGPAVSLPGVKGSIVLRSALKSGAKIKARCAAVACSLKATITVDDKTARKLKLGKKRTLASGSGKGKADRTATLRVRFAKALAAKLRKAKNVQATLTVTASAGSERTVVSRALKLR